VPAHRKSGIRARRDREAKRLRRDKKIYRFIEGYAESGAAAHYYLNEPIEPLSVYMGKPGNPFNETLAPFPVGTQPNKRPMPQWNDLSAWMKVQLSVMLLHQWTFQTFNIHIDPKLEKQWLNEGRDVREVMRDRLRRELDRHLAPRREFFFVVEGWSKHTKAPTRLHIHGAAAIYESGDGEKIEAAAARAAGQGLRGRKYQPRAVHSDPFTRAGPAYINYLFKSVNRRDARLPERRLTMSRSVVNATRDFWNTITGKIDW
jgi:hypothetical protein